MTLPVYCQVIATEIASATVSEIVPPTTNRLIIQVLTHVIVHATL